MITKYHQTFFCLVNIIVHKLSVCGRHFHIFSVPQFYNEFTLKEILWCSQHKLQSLMIFVKNFGTHVTIVVFHLLYAQGLSITEGSSGNKQYYSKGKHEK